MYLNEDDGRPDGHQTVEFHQNIVLGLITIAVEVDLFDALHGQVLVLKGHLIGVRCKCLRVGDHVVREGGREQDDLNVLGKHPGNLSVETRPEI